MNIKNGELLKQTILANVVCRGTRPSDMGVFLSDNQIYTDPVLTENVAEALALEISDATNDGRRVPIPTYILATGVKSSIFSHYIIRSLSTLGMPGIKFKWTAFSDQNGCFNVVPQEKEDPTEGRKTMLVVMCHLRFDEKARRIIWDAQRDGDTKWSEWQQHSIKTTYQQANLVCRL